MNKYRINGFDQIKAFYSWVFNNQDLNIHAQHISLYLFLINQNNRANWVEWFKCPFDLAMEGSCIGSKSTYYATLEQLKDWGLIDYRKGTNNYKAPLIKICLFKSVPQSVPLCEPQLVPLSGQASVPLSGNIYKLITDNYKQITKYYDKFEKFVLSLSTKDESKEEHKKDDSSIDYEALMKYFNETFNGKLKAITIMTPKRKQAVHARAAEHGKEAIQKAFNKILCSKFLLGDNDRNWQCDFDWIFKPTNFIKILEGNFDTKVNSGMVLTDNSPDKFKNEKTW